MKITIAAALSVVGLVLASGCDAGADPDADAGPTASPTSAAPSAEPTPQADAPLELTTNSQRSTSCLKESGKVELAWFESEWKANEDLESFRFSLVDAAGVRSVGFPINVPPVNYGGRIDYSGATSWDRRDLIGKQRFVSWSQRDSTDAWTPIEDQTGLVVFHLRFTEPKASIGGVRASYVTADGEKGSVEVAMRERFIVGGRCPF
ncbi:MAG: hypothetical protein JWO76_1199 [Nocardioides sp.]|nr:hypothetical protein [Nocardioides sp.]